MGIRSFKTGPGTLKFGAAGVFDASCQVRECTVIPKAETKKEDAIDVLCGESLAAEETVSYTYSLKAKVLQDLQAAGLVAYSWTNKGLTIPFEFIPVLATAAKVSGTLRMDPISIGGAVKERAVADIELTIIGTPVFTPAV